MNTKDGCIQRQHILEVKAYWAACELILKAEEHPAVKAYLKARKFEANSGPVDKIPPGSILAIRKQARNVTSNSPGHTKQDKQDNETKLIRKENESQ